MYLLELWLDTTRKVNINIAHIGNVNIDSDCDRKRLFPGGKDQEGVNLSPQGEEIFGAGGDFLGAFLENSLLVAPPRGRCLVAWGEIFGSVLKKVPRMG